MAELDAATDENPCLTFFEANSGNNQKVKLLREQPRLTAFEGLTASRLSPCIVGDAEEVLRQVFSPLHVEQDTGALKPTAFDDASDKGLSVDRVDHQVEHASVQAGHARAAVANAKEGSTPRKLHGIAKLKVSEVRSLCDGEARHFGVYDTALDANRAHADICQLIAGKSSGRRARSKLVEMAQPFVNVVVEPEARDIIPTESA
ncbi:hypothetical protein [Paraburkholderia bannensis]|uniref:hypothetical protein n=1 Tax=Paraburkholderia bannensis TaxID=765414 RepID=UPI0005A87989|nr:hypothetical protein [Paraburkholderia bannensis]